MKTTYTPGPWEVSKHGTPASHPQFGVYAQEARNYHVIVKGDNAKADASLISAAPEILAALETMEQHYAECVALAGHLVNSNPAIVAARAAIAKAKGDA